MKHPASDLKLVYAENILDCILHLQRANCCVSEKDLATAIILILLSQHNELTLSQLINYLHCQQSYLSQLISQLVSQGLISERRDGNDLRFRYYSLGKKGQKEIIKLDLKLDGVLSEQSKDLEAVQQKKLAVYLQRLNDGAKITAQNKREHEHIIRPQQRRLSALLGISGRKIIGIEISSTVFHVLNQVFHYNALLSVKNIAESLFLDPSQISTLVKGLRKQKLLDYSTNPFDERSKLLTLTGKGIDYVKLIRKQLVDKISSYLIDFELKEIKDLAELFSLLILPTLKVEQLSKNELNMHRGHIIQFCSLNKIFDSFPAEIAGENTDIYFLKLDKQIICYAQICKNQNLLNLLSWQPGLTLGQVWDFALATLKLSGASLRPESNLLKIFEKACHH